MKSLPYYTPSAVDDTGEVIKDICAEVGLTVEKIPTEQTTANPDSSVFLVSEDS
ncbi:hypothetical protein [Natrinema sp. 74]|uniref:hypothetical protein n=1 Tax=Natrinema sp. 74 TaxID=3384159 RepID=UPI0038D456D8